MIRFVKNLEIVIMLVAAYGFLNHDVVVLLACVFLMGLHSTLFGPVKFALLPQVLNELRRASVEVSYSLTSRLSAGFAYAYEDFEVNDFQTSPGFAVGSRTLPDGIVLGYYLRPYTAHTGGVRLTVFW